MDNGNRPAPVTMAAAISHQRTEYPADSAALDRLSRYLETTRPSLREIKAAVCEFYLVGAPDLMGESREAGIVLPRQIFCYLAHHLTRHSLTNIAHQVGDRHHTSILNAIRRVDRLMMTKPLMADDLDVLKLRIEEGRARRRGIQ